MDIKGEAGNFQVEVLKQPRYVDEEKCIACGLCAEKCPKKVPDPYNTGLSKRKAIYVEYAQAVPLKYGIDAKNCIYLAKGKCGNCAKVCPTGAVDYDQKAETLSLSVGAVLLSPGFTPFDPASFDNFQYTKFKNVITSMEFERILSPAGPTEGHLKTLSDGKEPEKIAWLQCVGSRDINRCSHEYCSSVCCMYAIKGAVIAKEHAHGDLDTAVFYMDIRTYGKDFERYYNKAEHEAGVRFVRSRVHTIEEDPETKQLHMRYTDDAGATQVETFDMVVLSVGMEIGKGTVDLAGRLGIELDQDNFAKTQTFSPVETTRKGIYVCGAFQEPKDIPYSVMEASAAACEAQASLSEARGTLTKEITYPEERDIAGEEPRIGVFVCNCGVNIGGIVDVPKVAEYAKTLPGVVYVEENLFTCSQDTQELMKQVIEKERLNRVVVAACTPRTHEELFQETLKDASLNKYLFEMANIRNQCSWVHSNEKEAATEKSMDLVRMAVKRAGLIKPLPQPTIPVDRKALVIGGGIAGMTAALGLADQGFATSIVEQGKELGGNGLAHLKTWKGEEIATGLSEILADVKNHPAIEIHTETTVAKADGFVGNFKTTLTKNGEEKAIDHGAVIVAVGAEELQTEEYLHGSDDRVMTHMALDRALSLGTVKPEETGTAIFVQCVGSREEARPYCSKVCCTHTVKTAISFKERNPEMDIYVLYRDIRTYGQREALYNEARRLGIIFIRYDLDQKPVAATEGDQLTVTARDHVLGMDLKFDTDLLVLASAIVPREASADLAKMYQVPVSEDGFFMEAHVKLKPVDCQTAGIYLAGMAHYPKPIEESIAQARAAASRASVVLAKDSLTVEGIVSTIDADNCRACGKCVTACPFTAIEIAEDASYAAVHAALCKGCGACAVTCPTGAANICHYDDGEVLTMVEAALEM